MSGDPAAFPGPDEPPAVGAFVAGHPDGHRAVVRHASQLAAYHELHDDVETTHDYDLAYYHHDYATGCARHPHGGH